MAQLLQDHTAVVTGSSSGIGRAIALAFAHQGAGVIVHGASNRQGADEVATLVREAGRKCLIIMSDLADSTQHAPLVDQAWNWQGGVDIWVNNAGADVLTGSAAGWTFEHKLDRLWQVDVRATIGISRAIGARMKQRGRGTILNMGWDQAEHGGMAGESGEMFAATKGAIMAFTRSLASSLAPEVRVNCLAPGWIRTQWGEQASEYWQAKAVEQSLLGRWGTPEDVADAATFLASPAASFITAQTFCVNGGVRSEIGEWRWANGDRKKEERD